MIWWKRRWPPKEKISVRQTAALPSSSPQVVGGDPSPSGSLSPFIEQIIEEKNAQDGFPIKDVGNDDVGHVLCL